MSKKEKRTTPVDLPKEYRVVVMHFAKHKSYRVYCKKYGTKKGEEIISLLHDLISSRLQNQEFVFWLDPDTALLTLEKERYRSVCEELELSFSEKIYRFICRKTWNAAISKPRTSMAKQNGILSSNSHPSAFINQVTSATHMLPQRT